VGFSEHVRVWSDVMDEGLDEESAPSLGGVFLGSEHRIYVDPGEFFKRTLLTREMVRALENVGDVLAGRGGSRVTLIQSLFGGGKTHTMLAIYHAVRSPRSLLMAKVADEGLKKDVEDLVRSLESIGSISIVSIDGKYESLAPTYVKPIEAGGYRVKTLWGSIAHQLGVFELVREYDEKVLPPQMETVKKLLEKRPVLILVDELAHHVVSLKNSMDRDLRSYGDQLIRFLETLVDAVSNLERVSLVISLPVDDRGSIEESYRGSQDIVLSMVRVVNRVSARAVIPVSPGELASILRVRIFEHVDRSAARAEASRLESIYRSQEFKEVFGSEGERAAREASDTYPFHPEYVRVLRDIVDKHEGLQKTRDAIKITRKVVRSLIRSKSQAEMIMPFHIDPEEGEVRAILLSHSSYRGFETALDEDLRRASGYEKPELAKKIVKSIFLMTFVYGGAVARYILYPDMHRVLVASYLPLDALSMGASPKDYVDALEWLSKNLYYLVSDKGRYWFTQIKSPIRLVEEKARGIDDLEAERLVEEKALKLLLKTSSEVISRRGARQHPTWDPGPFSTGSSRVLRVLRPIEHDQREYVVVAALNPPAPQDIEDAIYRLPNGSERRNANTIYIAYPGSRDNYNNMIRYAKLLKACDEVLEEIESIYTDKDVMEVMERKLNSYCYGENGVEGRLVMNILDGIDRVAYPAYSESDKRKTYVEVTKVQSALTIMDGVVKALTNARPKKVYPENEFSFDILDHLLSQIGIKLSEGSDARKFTTLHGYFFENPRLPAISRDILVNVIKEGVKELKIGVKSGGKIFFKKIYRCESRDKCSPPQVEEGSPPESIGLEDEILPWRLALKEQLEGLKGVDEKKEGDVIRRRWHGVYLHSENKVLPIEDALKNPGLDVIKGLPVVEVLETIRIGVDIGVDAPETASPGEEVAVNIFLTRVGDFSGEVSVDVLIGGSSAASGKANLGPDEPSHKLEFRLKVPEKPGEHIYEVRVSGPSGEDMGRRSFKIVVKPKAGEIVRGIPQRGAKVEFIEISYDGDTNNLAPIYEVSKKLGSACIVKKALLKATITEGDLKPVIKVEVEGLPLSEFRDIVASGIAQRFGIKLSGTKYTIELVPRSGKYIEAPEFSEEEKKKVENHIRYKLYEEG
jgi:predicted AAA+ superfamily ATPase